MTLSPDVCTECAGHKYDDEGLPCEGCNGTGREPQSPKCHCDRCVAEDAAALDALIEMAKEER